MNTSSISEVFKNAGGTATTSGNKRQSELNMQTFLQLLVTQLANQNPLEPMKDADFYAQLAQLGQVQGNEKMLDVLQGTQSNSLIGKEVVAVRPSTESGTGMEDTVTGIVTRLQVKDGEYVLGVREADGGIVDVKLANVQEVHDAKVDTSMQDMVQMASVAGLVGKSVTAPHPTLKGSDGKPEIMTGPIKKVSFGSNGITLTVTDRLGKDVTISLASATSFGS